MTQKHWLGAKAIGSLLIAALSVACSKETAETPLTSEETAPTLEATALDAEGDEHLHQEPIVSELVEQDETLYQDRFSRMVDAFRTGKSITTIYDTRAQLLGAANPTFPLQSEIALVEEATRDAILDYAKKMKSSALIVVKNDEVVLEEYFDGTDATTPLNSKSLAKPLGVIAVGRAIASGKIASLDQPVSDFIEEWQGTPKAKITIRHLLGMRSGLQHQINDPSPDHVINRAYLHPRHDEVIINDYPQTDEPGARYDYSNANAELIAPLIERATGVPYPQWLSEEVIGKLGAEGGEIWLNREGGVAHAGCCAMLPARTFAKLGLLVLNDGVWGSEQLLPAGFVEEMKQPAPDNIHAGLGLYIGQPFKEYRGFHNPDRKGYPTFHSEPYSVDDVVLFDGNSNQVVYMSPSTDTLILRMGSTPPRETPWDNAFLPNLIFEALKSE